MIDSRNWEVQARSGFRQVIHVSIFWLCCSLCWLILQKSPEFSERQKAAPCKLSTLFAILMLHVKGTAPAEQRRTASRLHFPPTSVRVFSTSHILSIKSCDLWMFGEKEVPNLAMDKQPWASTVFCNLCISYVSKTGSHSEGKPFLSWYLFSYMVLL